MPASPCSSATPPRVPRGNLGGGANKVVFVGAGEKLVTGAARGKARAFARVAGKDSPDDASTRSKLGGHPRWLQGPERVTCSTCKEPMAVVLQIDSAIQDFGDAGIGYILLCPKEHAGAALWQG
jgi:hypothetical protein